MLIIKFKVVKNEVNHKHILKAQIFSSVGKIVTLDDNITS